MTRGVLLNHEPQMFRGQYRRGAARLCGFFEIAFRLIGLELGVFFS